MRNVWWQAGLFTFFCREWEIIRVILSLQTCGWHPTLSVLSANKPPTWEIRQVPSIIMSKLWQNIHFRLSYSFNSLASYLIKVLKELLQGYCTKSRQMTFFISCAHQCENVWDSKYAVLQIRGCCATLHCHVILFNQGRAFFAYRLWFTWFV